MPSAASRSEPDANPKAAERSLRNTWRGFLRNKGAAAGLAVVLVFCLVAVLAPVTAPYSPLSQSPTISRLPSHDHLLGTDPLGRDILSRAIYGARISLFVGFSAVTVGLLLGASLGLLCAYLGGRVDDMVMRGIDMLMAIPAVILAMSILAALGPSLGAVVIAIAISSLPSYARLARAQTLYQKQMDYVMAARAMGGGRLRIMARHILPNIVGVLVVAGTTSVGSAILTEAGLSFLGLGVPPPTPTWGAMVSEGRQFIFIAPHVGIIPGLFIMLAVLACNLAGDGLRDAIDPRSMLR